MLQIYLLI